MKRISITIVVALSLTLLLYAGCQTVRSNGQMPKAESQKTTQQQAISLERTISTQQRINRYFHSDVVPKLKSCWSGVQGEGMISIQYIYTKDASGRWAWEGLEVDTSTLPKGQDAIALECMEQSVRGTSFPVEGGDGTGDKFVVIWSWPVPFPANADEQTSAMFAARPAGGGGRGGCDGRGTKAKCIPDYCVGGKCPTGVACVGWKLCALSGGPEGGCLFSVPCASGGPFGVGGIIMY